MSTINMFDQLVGNSVPQEQTATKPAGNEDWKAQPITDKQYFGIIKMFVRKNLAAESDPVWIAKMRSAAETQPLASDPSKRNWVGLRKLTRGEAKDLQDRLYNLPWSNGNSKATTGKAAPLTEGQTIQTDRGLRQWVKGRLVKSAG